MLQWPDTENLERSGKLNAGNQQRHALGVRRVLSDITNAADGSERSVTKGGEAALKYNAALLRKQGQPQLEDECEGSAGRGWREQQQAVQRQEEALLEARLAAVLDAPSRTSLSLLCFHEEPLARPVEEVARPASPPPFPLEDDDGQPCELPEVEWCWAWHGHAQQHLHQGSIFEVDKCEGPEAVQQFKTHHGPRVSNVTF